MAASSASLHRRQSSASACVAEAGAGWPRWWSPRVFCSWRSSASSSSSSPSPSASSSWPSPCRSSRTAPRNSRPRTRDETNWNLSEFEICRFNLLLTKKYSFVPKNICLISASKSSSAQRAVSSLEMYWRVRVREPVPHLVEQ